jgi:hypothetical protein
MLSIEGSKRFKKWISSFKPKDLPATKSIEKEAVTAVSFKAEINNVDLNYAMAFYTVTDDEKIFLDHFALLPPIPAENGVNGEVRPIVFTFEEYKTLLKKHKKEIEDLDDLLSSAIDAKKIGIKIFIYDDDDKKFMKDINNKRLSVVCLSLTYFLFTDTIATFYPEDIINAIKKIKKADVYKPPEKILAKKIYPLSIQEDYNQDRLNFGSWRDLIIANAASILKKHNVVPAVITVKGPWSRFRSSREIFDSKYLLDKFKESDNIEKKEDESDFYENNYKIMADVTLSYDFYFPNEHFSKMELSACNLFELLYSAYYLHHELKIIHTKLCRPEDSILVYKNTVVDKKKVHTYVVGPNGERDTYVFTAPEFLCEMHNFKAALIMTSSPLANKERISFDNSQLYYLIQLIQEHIDAEISPEDIKVSLRTKDYWYDIFNVIAVVDYMDICAFIQKNTDEPTKALCTKITQICTAYLDKGLKCIVTDLKRPEITFHTIWNEIREQFINYQFGNWAQNDLNKLQITHRYLYDELFNLYPKKEYKL